MYCNQEKTHDVNLGYLLVGMDVTQMFCCNLCVICVDRQGLFLFTHQHAVNNSSALRYNQVLRKSTKFRCAEKLALIVWLACKEQWKHNKNTWAWKLPARISVIHVSQGAEASMETTLANTNQSADATSASFSHDFGRRGTISQHILRKDVHTHLASGECVDRWIDGWINA